MLAVIYILIGLALLVFGGESLVRGAVGLAKRLGISTLVIGMTVVAFGTSAPELIVSIMAAFDGHADIAVGNVIGSNMSNIGLVLGSAALFAPLMVSRSSRRIDWPKMMYATLLFLVFAFDGQIVMWEGLVLFLSLIAFTVYIIRLSLREGKGEDKMEDVPEQHTKIRTSLFWLTGGVLGLWLGSDFLLDGSVDLAKMAGLSERVIGITIVAIGTSVPELVASVISVHRGNTDIAIGNVIGSNIFNISSVLGITSIITPVAVNHEIFNFDAYWLVGVPLLLLFLMRGGRIGRWAGGVLLASYVTYLTLTVLL